MKKAKSKTIQIDVLNSNRGPENDKEENTKGSQMNLNVDKHLQLDMGKSSSIMMFESTKNDSLPNLNGSKQKLSILN